MAHDPPRARGRAPLNPLLAGLLAVVAVAVLFLAGVAAQRLGGQDPAVATTATTPPARATPSRSPAPAIGDAVRDGKFEFVIAGVDCSRTAVGLEHLKRTAKGRFCVVDLSVRNIADDAKLFLGHAQRAFDSSGLTYRSDELAGLYANLDTETFLEKLDPGERVTGKLVFDVPEAARLTTLELHDSLLSGGVRVTLR